MIAGSVNRLMKKESVMLSPSALHMRTALIRQPKEKRLRVNCAKHPRSLLKVNAEILR